MKKLFINALIIIVTSLLFNTVGISFRVFLSNKIGTEGIGLLQLIFSVYMMAVLFVVTGINVAVTRLVAEEGGRVSSPVSRSLIVQSVSVSFLFSVPAFAFLFWGAESIGTAWLDDPRTIFPLKLLAVGMPFAGVSACIKGYYYAVGKLIRPTSAQAAELVVQILIIINIIDYFMQGGPEYACAAIAVGTTISELASCLFSLTLYWAELRNNDPGLSPPHQQRNILKKLLYISFPVSVSSLIRTSLKMLENIMVPIGFEKFGYSRKVSLEQYGKLHGMVMPILMFPSSVIIAFSALLIPEISEANALNQKKKVEYSILRALQLTCIMSVLVSGVFLFFSNSLGIVIYDSGECGALMKRLAPLIPLIYLDIVVDELLKALNQQVSVLRYNMLDATMKIVLIYYVLPVKGLDGLIFVLYAGGLFNTSISIRKLLKTTRLHFKAAEWIFKPILSVAASGILAVFLLDAAGKSRLTDILYLSSGAALTCIFYFFFLFKLGCLTQEDTRWFRSIFRQNVKSGL